jgi:hypothetical protein
MSLTQHSRTRKGAAPERMQLMRLDSEPQLFAKFPLSAAQESRLTFFVCLDQPRGQLPQASSCRRWQKVTPKLQWWANGAAQVHETLTVALEVHDQDHRILRAASNLVVHEFGATGSIRVLGSQLPAHDT